MEASDVKRLKALADENKRLKKMFANLSLEHEAVKDLIVKRVGDSRETRSVPVVGGVKSIDCAGL